MGTKIIFVSLPSLFFFASFFAATHAFPSDGPLNMLHADAVKFGAGAKDNTWFEAVDAKTLDGMITEMNTMNRWFAKVVKYWDDFTSGGDGAKVLAEQGKGINEDEPVDGDEPAADGDEPAADGDVPAEDGDEPAADGDEPAADGDDAAAEGDEPAAEGDEEPADGEAKGAKDADAEGDEKAEGGDKEEARKRRMKKMKRRMRKRL